MLENSTRTENENDIENALWNALDQALKTNENSILILNKLDQISDSEIIRTKFLKRLHSTCVHRATARCIVFTKSFSKPFSIPARHLVIQSKYIHEDLCHVAKRLLASHPHFHDRKKNERIQILHRITQVVKDSFVLMNVIVRLLSWEGTHEDFTQTLNNLSKTIPDVIQKLISHLDLTAAEIKLIISWLLITKRPLTLQEIQSLLEIETSTIKYKRRSIDVKELIRQTCGSLLHVRGEIVRFRHIDIRKYLDDLSKTGKQLFRREDAYRELTYRCLAYINVLSTSKTQCTTTVLNSIEVEDLFQTHFLLKYAARYWTKHFRGSLMYRQNDKHDLTSEFYQYFSKSVLQIQIEWTCWNTQFSIKKFLNLHRLTLNLRKIIFTKSHETMLQTLIIIARTYEKITNTTKVDIYYYEAFKLSRTIYELYSEIIIICAEVYLTITASSTTTTRIEIIIHREEMLQIIIATHEHHHGHFSKEVIRYQKQLVQLYMQIQEIIAAIKIHRAVYETCVEFYEEFHKKIIIVFEDLAEVLQRESWYEDVLLYLRLKFKRAEEHMNIMNICRIRITIRSYCIIRKISYIDILFSCNWLSFTSLERK